MRDRRPVDSMSTEELERIVCLRRILALVRERQKKAIHASGNRLGGLQAKAEAIRAAQAETQKELDALMPSALARAFAGEL